MTHAERIASNLTPLARSVIGLTPRKLTMQARQIARSAHGAQTIALVARQHANLFDRFHTKRPSGHDLISYRLSALGNDVRDVLERR